MERNYLVPHDFTEVADLAAKQGAHFALESNSKLCLLHIIKSEKTRAASLEKLKDLQAKLLREFDSLKVDLHVVKGNIFEDIGATAKNLSSSLVIMGTHGPKGMQKIFGSFAIKVIKNSSIPFLIVQHDSPIQKLERIIFPLGTSSESLQIMGAVEGVARAFGAEVHLIAEAQKDSTLIHKTNVNFQVVTKHMKAHKVNYKMELLSGPKGYEEKIMQYANDTSANIIAIAYHNENIIASTDRFAQHIITNKANIPTLIISSVSVTSSAYF